ncbi:MAG: trigger factor, partial [Bacteroidaceae bacterium]|nr:trigger factor [Bacteroidaceae bacterium]
WQMERDQLVKQTEIKVTDEELHQTAVQAARFQFAQYGINNIPDQYLENYAKDMLTKEEQRANLMERAIETKLSSALKNVVKLNRKSVTLEEFNKLFEK